MPPEAAGNVPVVSTEVDVAYTAPPEVKEARPVPPDAVPRAFVRLTVPLLEMLIAVVAPLLPTLNRMLSVVPMPEVDCRVSEDEAVVPPTINGDVVEVLNTGFAIVETVTAPTAADTAILVPAAREVTAAPESVVHVGTPVPPDVRIWPDVPAAEYA